MKDQLYGPDETCKTYVLIMNWQQTWFHGNQYQNWSIQCMLSSPEKLNKHYFSHQSNLILHVQVDRILTEPITCIDPDSFSLTSRIHLWTSLNCPDHYDNCLNSSIRRLFQVLYAVSLLLGLKKLTNNDLFGDPSCPPWVDTLNAIQYTIQNLSH